MTIEVNNETSADVDVKALSDLARFVLERMRIHPEADLAVVLVDPGAMEQLHVQWMDEPGPTDVLSFPMDELRPPSEGEEPVPGLLGDIVLCPDVAAEQARGAGHSTEEELHLLTTHGILHLLGYDHAEPDEEREMFGLQKELLSEWRDWRNQREQET
ncbi:rRNA maturation RNase YbeY [Actinobacteria bacterium YIM 96077]|uniref:Endoribonuclease YbeY n=1 Tax=Phytoactinopolyspora halophila TaxID=1981511 RepID=A0A329QFE4_9ACTN|nr:rRNA maturation RNase YbeY [Phytoactinopolyspora halophila]AYY14079.1 rRNA maturation RNase YbeY [Actinobacteria bacterium YIM 96077]RAW10986.1 rRNA maturation RNase YbeY [Phytoactinopolyspora halophila]